MESKETIRTTATFNVNCPRTAFPRILPGGYRPIGKRRPAPIAVSNWGNAPPPPPLIGLWPTGTGIPSSDEPPKSCKRRRASLS